MTEKVGFFPREKDELVEIFYSTGTTIDGGLGLSGGWYYWFRSEGFAPMSKPSGPYKTSELAYEAMME